MRKHDARKMSRDELLESRHQVIRLYNENMPVMKIVESTGLSWPAVNAAIEKFKAGGMDALLPSKRGRKTGTDRSLSEGQELMLRTMLYRTRPNLLKPMIRRQGWNLYLWDRDAVAELIVRKCGVRLSKRCVAKYLERWGFPLLKKNQRPLERCSDFIQEKLKDEYEKIEERAAAENIQIFWISKKKLFFPIDQLTRLNKKFQSQLSLVTAINNRGKEYWLFFKGTYSEEQQIEFFQTLLKEARGRIILIRDDSKYYTENMVTEWLCDNKNRIELYPPPPPSRR